MSHQVKQEAHFQLILLGPDSTVDEPAFVAIFDVSVKALFTAQHGIHPEQTTERFSVKDAMFVTDMQHLLLTCNIRC